eukprot:4006639-Prymnesium_polylepis.1
MIARPRTTASLAVCASSLVRPLDRMLASRLSGHACTVRSADRMYAQRWAWCCQSAWRRSREHKSTRVR